MGKVLNNFFPSTNGDSAHHSRITESLGGLCIDVYTCVCLFVLFGTACRLTVLLNEKLALSL